MVSGIEFHIFTLYICIEDALTLELQGKLCISLCCLIKGIPKSLVALR